ncbi:MAG: hypothetical protein JSR19_01380 [Proteobacteria bacterium]|nr:hypothetical protein [Pseudomonadota bacterium]HQR02501.1 hypothetical protein [Rhodocyclaceae bacterium]
MNAQVQELQKQTIKANQILIVGRVEDVRRWESGDGCTVTVISPAPDEYSQPNTYEIQTTGRAQVRKGDDFKQLCTLSGWMKKGRDPGQKFNNLRLRAVEAF